MTEIPFGRPCRRDLLRSAACGFGSLALAGLLSRNARGLDSSAAGEGSSPAANPLAPKPVHHPARAKRVIFVYMQGGPSHLDTFDPKPRLAKDDGKEFDFKNARVRKVRPERVLKSPWKFAQHGRAGTWVSELFPEMAKHVDDFCLIRSVHTEGVAHGPATLMLNTGSPTFVRPSVGAWVTYGLGTENQNLPGYVTINPSANMGGPRNYSNAFLPAFYQGTAVGRAGLPSAMAKIKYVENQLLSSEEQNRTRALLGALHAEQTAASPDDDALAAAIASSELAYRMQTEAPDLFDISNESAATQALYGIGEKATDDFGRQCLLARRMAEAGVRFIQVNYSDNSNNPRWDQHSNLKLHEQHARATDKPVAGLLQDLKARGLLEDTLVWWGGEFGRTPFAEGRDGRDHNPTGFSIWLAGAGTKAGLTYGETDEFGHHAVVDKVHMHDLHATILHLLGLDHERLTYTYAGRPFRLTDVHGRVVHDVFA